MVNTAFKSDGVQNGGSYYLKQNARAAVMHYTRHYFSSSFAAAVPVLFPLTRQTGVRVVRFLIDKLESY